MAPDHAWAGKAHHFPDPLAHLWFVAVYWAVLAGGFFDPEWAFGQPFLSVAPKLGAFLAERISTVLPFTVYADHRPQCGSFLR